MRKSISGCKDYIVVLYHKGMRTPMESYSKFKDAEARQNAITARCTRALVGVVDKEYALILEADGELAWGKSL